MRIFQPTISGSVTVTETLTVLGGITGSISGSVDTATSASYALTASYALNGGGGAAFPFTGSAEITGSLVVTGSLASGLNNIISGQFSHAEGDSNNASGSYSHAEGTGTLSLGLASHAEGDSTQAIGNYSHTEGYQTQTGGTNGYLATSVVSGVVTLSGSYGNISTDYSAGDYLYLNDLIYDDSYSAVGLKINSASFDGTNTQIFLVDTSISTSTAVVGNINQGVGNWSGDQTYRGDWSHAEGYVTSAIGLNAHAEGSLSVAVGSSAHAEGLETQATGDASHAEGDSTQAIGVFSHAEGLFTQAIGQGSHAEGNSAQAIGEASHAEGNLTKTGGTNGYLATSITADPGGSIVTLSGSYGDVTADYTAGNILYINDVAYDNNYTTVNFTIQSSSYDGTNTQIFLVDPNITTTTAVVGSANLGALNWAGDQTFGAPYSHAEGNSSIAVGTNSHAEGVGAEAYGDSSHAEGYFTQAIGDYSHAEGYTTQATGEASHAEGQYTIASGSYSHAEGLTTIAQGAYSHAEGNGTISSGIASHAEGASTQAIGDYSHAEGRYTHTTGSYSHAEGFNSRAIGDYTHTEGQSTIALGSYSHAEGIGTIASGSGQHVSGKYNTHGDTTSLFIIGNGADDANRSDIVRVTPTDVQVSGSLNVTGSQVYLTTDDFRVTSPSGTDLLIIDGIGNVDIYDISGTSAASVNARQLSDSAGGLSVDWENRQLIKSDSSISVDWENGIFSGSFSGSFVGDGSQLTGVVATDLAFPLSQSAGITAFTFDGSAPAVVEVSGASTLNSNTVTKWTGNAFANTNITDNGSLVNVNSATNVTGSLNISGSQVIINTDDFQVINPNTTWPLLTADTSNGIQLNDLTYVTSVDAQQRLLPDTSGATSIDWENRYLYKSDGTTVAFDWENGQMTGSLNVSGSVFVTGSQISVNADTLDFTLIGYTTPLLTLDESNGVLLYNTSGQYKVSTEASQLVDDSSAVSVEWASRQLIKSDGTTVSVDWENGIFSGSFSGSFQGDGSQLTGIASTLLVSGSTGGGSVNLQTETLSVVGTANEIETSASGQTITIGLPSDVTIGNDLTVQGDLIVQGTASFQNTENLLVADRFVLFASGSNTTGDGGIVVQQGTQNVGELYGFDSGVTRWGFTSSFSANQTSFTPDAYIAAVVDVDGGQSDIARYQKAGNIKVQGGDIYIYV